MRTKHPDPSLDFGLTRMKATGEPTQAVQGQQPLKCQQLGFAIVEASEAIVKADRTLEQCSRRDIEPDPLHPIGYRQMLQARRSDYHGSGNAQSVYAEGVGVVRCDRFGCTTQNGTIDRSAPDDMPSIAGR